jgi:hypothetical protein
VQYTAYRSESIDGVVAGISDDGTEIAASSTDISFDSGLSVTDDGDGTVSIDSLWNSTSSDAYFTGGNVGIGTTSPSVALSASGTISQTNATNCTLEADGNGNIICSTSDENLKTDKQTIDNALGRLSELEGYTYRFKNENRFGEGGQIGFMAQDVEQVFPQLVRDTGEYKTLDYGNMTAVLAEAIKDLNKKVESQVASTSDTNTAPEETTASSKDTTTSSSTQQQATTTSTSTDSTTASSSSTSTDSQTDSGVITTVTNWLSDQATTIKNGVVAAADGFFGTVTTEQLVIDSSPATSTANGDETPDSSAGSGKIAESATTTTIFNDRVATSSQVIVTMTGRHQGNHWVNKQQNKFSVNMSEKQQATTTFDYIVIGVKDASAKEAMASSSASSTDDVAGTSTLQEGTKNSSSTPDLGPMIDKDTYGDDPSQQDDEGGRPERRSDETESGKDETASSTATTTDEDQNTAGQATTTKQTASSTDETASSTDSTEDVTTSTTIPNQSDEPDTSGQASSTQETTDTASSTDSHTTASSTEDGTQDDATDEQTTASSTGSTADTDSDTTATSTYSANDTTNETASSTENS